MASDYDKLRDWMRAKAGEPPHTCPTIDAVLRGCADVAALSKRLTAQLRYVENSFATAEIEEIARELDLFDVSDELERIRAANDWLRGELYEAQRIRDRHDVRADELAAELADCKARLLDLESVGY